MEVTVKPTEDPDLKKGAVEGDATNEEGRGNQSAPALDESGMPADSVAIAQDVVGANVDESQG